MHAVNGAEAPGSALDVIEVREASPIDAYLESSRRTTGRIIEELTDLRDAEQQLVTELTRQASEARARQTNYQRALDALGARKYSGDRAAKAKPKAKPRPHDWQVSDEKVAEVKQRMIALLPESPHKAGNGLPAITAGWIADNTDGLTPESAKKALGVLREREEVRVAGTSRGGGVLFALMPEGTDGD